MQTKTRIDNHLLNKEFMQRLNIACSTKVAIQIQTKYTSMLIIEIQVISKTTS